MALPLTFADLKDPVTLTLAASQLLATLADQLLAYDAFDLFMGIVFTQC